MDVQDAVGLFPVAYFDLGFGWILGVIATVHILASHVSVGAGLISAWLATVAVHRNRPELLEYIRQYGLFLLVFSYVLGSITGPGIWFAATIASPRGLSSLIHLNVWLWAVEWLFFVIEVIGIYVLVYLNGRVDPRSYLTVAWIFGAASFATLLVIAGILSFMLFPGQESWYTKGGSFRAIFSAYTFTQVFGRTCFMLVAAALTGGLIAVDMKDNALKLEMTKKLSVLGFVAAMLGFMFFRLSLKTIPDTAELLLANHLPGYFVPTLWAILLITLGYFAALWRNPDWITKPIAAVMLVLILVLGIYPGEKAREIMRKPYVAAHCIYPNGIYACDIPALGIKSELDKFKDGVLNKLAFIPDKLRHITPENELAAGKVIAENFCGSCHGLNNAGPRPLNEMFANNSDPVAIAAFIKGGLMTGNIVIMPKVSLTEQELQALARFIAHNNKQN
ncbi:MAG: cytochrome c [Methyloglobulus sp.]